MYNPKDYWDKRLTKNFNLQGVGYYSFSNNYNKWLYKAKIRQLEKLLSKLKFFYNENSVCDIGCGTGFFTKWFYDQGITSYTGIDISRQSILKLKNKFTKYSFYEYAVGDNKPLPFKNKFSLVLMFDVIYHIVDDIKFTKAVSQIENMLTDNGYFFVTDFYRKYDINTSDHAKQRSKTSWQKVLKNTSLKIKSVIPLYITLNRPIGTESYFIKKLLFYGARIPWLLYYLDGLLFKFLHSYSSMNLLVIQKQKSTHEAIDKKK